jgi:hypothetical protein
MKLKLPAIILTLFLVLTLVPAAFAQIAGEEVSDFCLDTSNFLLPEEGFQHPVGSGIALRYDVAYEVVMTWFCQDNYGFGQIMLALETSKVLPNSSYQGVLPTPQELLEMKTTLGGWGQVWKELEFIGRPKGDDWAGGPPPWAGPKFNGTEDIEGEENGGPPPWAGPPKWAGPKDKDRSPGPPSWAGPEVKPPTP